ncbi:MAG TPA: PAS domain-containing protein, partial [Actinomycetota bacterium]|nr:PAS domain-containing protein [Actinomycetota bacterium]
MAALHPIADLDGGHPQPRLAGAARSARPVPAPATLRRVEPLAAVFLGLHGVMVLANLAVEAELELGRRERLGRALLDALTDPTAVLDPQGRIVAVNQAWARFAAGDLAMQAGQSYPVACCS